MSHKDFAIITVTLSTSLTVYLELWVNWQKVWDTACAFRSGLSESDSSRHLTDTP